MIVMHIICSIFDLFLLYIYIHEMLGTPKVMLPALYYSAFIADELLLTISSFFLILPSALLRSLLTLLLSFGLTFALTLMYESSLKHRLFVTFSFQLCASFSELLILLIFSVLPQNLASILAGSNLYGALCSKILLFLFCNIMILFFKRKNNLLTSNYTALVLLMPMLSLILILAIPLDDNSSPIRITLGFIASAGILIANIVNYFLLQNILKLHEVQQEKSNLQNQIAYQTGKYQQLSNAYKDTRRMIHDTKNHFFFIQTNINNGNYNEITPYLQHAISDLEKNYILINTGNLVIDSFVSNFVSMAQKEGIQWHTDIQVNPNSITVRDYDLSIILGNLLDNALAACRQIQAPAPRQVTIEIITSSRELVIHIANTIQTFTANTPAASDSLNHGYGTKNIEAATLSYYGVYTHYLQNDCYHAIVSLPFHVSPL